MSEFPREFPPRGNCEEIGSIGFGRRLGHGAPFPGQCRGSDVSIPL